MQELYHLKIFTGIPKETIDIIIKNASKKVFAPWQAILRQGENSNGEWYIITSGEVEVFVNETLTTSLISWDIFWEIALLSDEKRNATIQAKTETHTLVLTQNMLLQLMEHDDSIINKTIIQRIEENIKK